MGDWTSVESAGVLRSAEVVSACWAKDGRLRDINSSPKMGTNREYETEQVIIGRVELLEEWRTMKRHLELN